MSSTTKKSLLRGLRDGAPFLLVVGPFGMLFGVVATESGLNLAQTMGFSFLVIAGAAQFAALQLMVESAPTLMVLATALAVNLRMAMYSAALVPHLGAAPLWQRAVAAYFLVDQTYAASVAEYEKRPGMTTREKLAYFFGVLLPVCPLWYVFTLVGALVGETIPESLALDFAVPITFLALVAPMLKTLAHLAAAVTSVAMAVGAGVEVWSERRAAWS
jgi:predicted branched-subunit amino acid permease